MPGYKRKRSASTTRTTKRRSYAKRKIARRTRRYATRGKPLVRLIKNVQLRSIETMHRTITASVQDIKHNTLYNYPVHYNTSLMWPPQGNADGERTGDQIYALGIKLTGMFHTAHDRKNVQIKCWWCPYNSNQGNPLTYNDWFYNISGTAALDDVQYKRWPGTKFLGTLKVTGRDVNEAAQATIPFKFYIPMRKNIKFLSDTSRVVSNMPENGVFMYTAYDTFQSLATDTVIVRAQFHATLYWKDP